MSRRKKISEKEVCDGLRRLAFGEITDAVSLLFEPEEKILLMVNEQTDTSPTSFYEALEKSTQATKRHYTEEFDE